MDLPLDLYYTSSHEWVRKESDGNLTIGLTNHAQDTLGDIIFLELPQIGARYAKGDPCAVIESVKAASDIYAPVAGEITDINNAAQAEPGAINEQPHATWLFRILPEDGSDTDDLLSAEAYKKTLD